MDHPIQCQCGKLKGVVVRTESGKRAICYCNDCQAFARFLGEPQRVLDAQGGTEVVATHPGNVRFTEGIDALRCMSLSPKGLLRWYAGCCNTAIGNTTRDWKTAYVGVVHTSLPSQHRSLESSFGPIRLKVQTKTARGHVDGTPAVSNALTMAGIVAGLMVARFGGSYRRTPFFDEAGVPVVSPLVITKEQRESLARVP